MIRPDPRELQELVQELHHRRTPWLPSGLGSRLDWGAPLPPGLTLLSTAGLNRVIEHSSGDFTVTVEAGLPLRQLQEELALQRQWLALDRPWGSQTPEGDGSVGGLVARGMAGGYRQRYLGVRDQVIGLKLLRSDGVLAQAGGRVVKNVAGYDLMRLFTGSWGCLGLITELTLRTMPLPPLRRGLLVQGPLAALAALARQLLGSSLTPERIDWWTAGLAAALAAAGAGGGAVRSAEPALLVALASVDAEALAEQLAWLQQQTTLPALSLSAEALEALLSASGSSGPRAAGGGWLLRLGVRPDQLASLLARAELHGICGALNAGSGLGLAWAGSAELDAAAVLALRQHCRAGGGQLTVLRQPTTTALAAWDDAPSRPLIEAVKASFDPCWQLAPGRLPGVEPAAALAAARRAWDAAGGNRHCLDAGIAS